MPTTNLVERLFRILLAAMVIAGVSGTALIGVNVVTGGWVEESLLETFPGMEPLELLGGDEAEDEAPTDDDAGDDE
jgi:hypothetical protein